MIFILDVKLFPMVLWYTPSLRDDTHFAADDTPSLRVMNTEYVQSLFAAQPNVFDPILGQPNDADLTRLHKELTTILLPLP